VVEIFVATFRRSQPPVEEKTDNAARGCALLSADLPSGKSTTIASRESHFLNSSSQTTGDFPNLDDIFLWSYHRTIRKRQRIFLEQELRSIAALLLDRNPLRS